MKRFKPLVLAPIAAFALALTGCVTPPPPPSDVAHIKLEQVDSSVVRVERLWLAREEGRLFAVGDVSKNLGADDTTRTHLDVVLLDANGVTLRETSVQFEPRQIPRAHRMHGHSRFHVLLDPLPPNVVRIEVRAHEGAH